MNWRATIAAGLIFIALLGFVWLETRQRVAGEGEVFRHRLFGLNLYGIDADNVTKLRVERHGEEPFLLEKRGEHWFITEPISAMASDDEVGRMIREIAELRPKTTREGVDLSRSDFGLEQPDITATITYDGNRTATLSLGAETPAGAERYAKVSADDNLHVVAATLRTTLWRDPETLREKRLVKIETDDVHSVTLDHGDEHVVAVRGSEGAATPWSLTAPLATAGDEWNLRQLVDNVRDLRADDFLSSDEVEDANPGFESPQATVKLDLAGGRSLTITFGNTASRDVENAEAERELVYATTSERDEILLVEAAALDRVRKTTFDLRDKSVVSFDRRDVTRIRVERTEDFSFSVGSRPDGWRVETPKSVEARQGAIDDILWNLEDLSAIEFVSEDADQRELREHGLAVPQTAITIEITGRRQPLKVLIGRQTADGNYYAMTSESNQIVKVSEFLMTDLPDSIEDLEKGEMDLPAWDDLFDDGT